VRVFTRVVLPALRPALIGASLLTFLAAVASFSAPYFFGQDYPMLSVRIFEERSQFHHAAANTLTVALAAIAVVGVVVLRTRRAPGAAGSKGAAAAMPAPRANAAAAILLWAATLVLLIPHMTILGLAFVDHRAWQTELIPRHFTLANFAALIQDPRAFAPIRNSVWMSALAAGVTLAVALPAAYLIGRKRPGGRVVHFLVMIPWMLPGTVIAMNLIAAFNEPWLPLYNTVWLLPLAYYIRGLPLLTRMACAAIEPFDAALIEAGRTLGASTRFCFLHIVAPILAPALIAATVLVFVTSLGEFVASILLYMPDNLPIAVKINMEWRGAVGNAFAYSVLLMALVLTTFLATRRAAARWF
jgi:iron(III) transport system permease protein